MANMVCTIGYVLHSKITEGKFTRENKEVFCYGILLGAGGHFGVSKLALNFEDRLGHFTDIVPFQARPTIVSICLFDFFLNKTIL